MYTKKCSQRKNGGTKSGDHAQYRREQRGGVTPHRRHKIVRNERFQEDWPAGCAVASDLLGLGAGVTAGSRAGRVLFLFRDCVKFVIGFARADARRARIGATCTFDEQAA